MSFHLVHHLPRLVAMVPHLSTFEKSEQFDLLFILFFINNQGKQHKMLISDPY